MPLGQLLQSVRPGSARLGAIQGVWPTLVGPGLSSCTRVHAVFGDKLVVAVTVESVRRDVEELERFLLRTLNRRVDGRPLVSVDYVVDPEYGGALDPGQGLRSPARALTAEESKSVAEAVAPIGDDQLRHKAQAWMRAVLSREEKT